MTWKYLKSLRFSVAALAAVGSLVVSPAARAEFQPRDVVPGRGLAMPASRAISTGNEAIFSNPAGLLAALRYTAQVDYHHATGPGADAVLLSVVDSKTNPTFPLAFGYRYFGGGGEDGYSGWTTDLASAVSVLGLFTIGGKLSYQSYVARGRDLKRFTGDVGVLVPIGPLSFGAVAHNLVNVDSPDAPRGVGVGAAFGDDLGFRVAADLRFDWPIGAREPVRSFMFSAETLLGGALPLRGGFEWDELRQSGYWSAGTGVVMMPFGFDLSVRRDDAGIFQWVLSAKWFGN